MDDNDYLYFMGTAVNINNVKRIREIQPNKIQLDLVNGTKQEFVYNDYDMLETDYNAADIKWLKKIGGIE